MNPDFIYFAMLLTGIIFGYATARFSAYLSREFDGRNYRRAIRQQARPKAGKPQRPAKTSTNF